MNDLLHEQIIFDTDGVLLDWVAPFAPWAATRVGRPLDPQKITEFNLTSWLGFEDKADMIDLVSTFNASDEHGFGRLPPLDGAVEAIQVLRDRGHKMSVVTSCSDDPVVGMLRVANLHAHFGDVFDDIIVLGLGADKTEALKKFTPSTWIDDHWPNLDAGVAAGHTPVLMNATYNQVRSDAGPAHYPRISDWHSFIEAITPARLVAGL
jgi:beta-phosphoglucomutase-like phosphatase (HAD superfamily)